jgi:hypothetical protein
LNLGGKKKSDPEKEHKPSTAQKFQNTNTVNIKDWRQNSAPGDATEQENNDHKIAQSRIRQTGGPRRMTDLAPPRHLDFSRHLWSSGQIGAAFFCLRYFRQFDGTKAAGVHPGFVGQLSVSECRISCGGYFFYSIFVY